jgi:hypothetical protein
MRAMLRLFAYAVIAFAVFTGAAWAVAHWQSGLVAALEPAAAARAYMAGLLKQDELESYHQAMRRCIEGKQEATNALLVGRLSLGEAADEFRRLEDHLNEAVPGRRREIGDRLMVGDDDASVYKNVLDWAEHSPSRTQERTARLDEIRTEVYAALHPPDQGL